MAETNSTRVSARRGSEGLAPPQPSPKSKGSDKRKKKKRRGVDAPDVEEEAELYGYPPVKMEDYYLPDDQPHDQQQQQVSFVNPPPSPDKNVTMKEEAAAVGTFIVEDENEKDAEGEDDVEEFEMEEDVYTLMFACGCSFASLYGLFTVALQITIIALFYIDVLSDNSAGNKLKVPVAIDKQVLIAQFLALPLCIMTHDDCTTALYQIGAEYDPTVREKHPGATRFSWIATLSLRFVVGFLLVFISFVQIVQATNITDMFLNLEAIVFVGNIDNFAFWLAEKNFLVRSLKDSCDSVKDITFKSSFGNHRTIIKRVLTLLTLGILITGWSFGVAMQMKGKFLEDAACNTFQVSFDDATLNLDLSNITISDDAEDVSIRTGFVEFIKARDADSSAVELLYSSFSGTYRIGTLPNSNAIEIKDQRAVYYEEIPGKRQDFRDPTLGKFFYCEGAWIFSIEAIQDAFDREDKQEEIEKCGGRWLLRSQPTEEYLLENVPSGNWRIWTGSVETAEGFSIGCNDCASEIDCNYHGKCDEETKQCLCDEGFGPRCNLDPPCLEIELVYIGESSAEYFDVGAFQLLDKTGKATDDNRSDNLLLVYGRPVYFLPFDPELAYYMYYLGSRWNIAEWYIENFQVYFVETDAPGHSFWDQLFEGNGYLASKPTRNGLPIGLEWEFVYQSRSRGAYGPFLARENVQIAFQCVDNVCPGANLCGDFGRCIDGRCECEECFGGYFCEFAPTELYARNGFINFAIGEFDEDYYYENFWAGLDPFANCTNAVDQLGFLFGDDGQGGRQLGSKVDSTSTRSLGRQRTQAQQNSKFHRFMRKFNKP